MTERLDQFSQLEIQMFKEDLDGLLGDKDVEDVMREEMVMGAKDMARGIVYKAIELGVARNKQYHSLPLANARYRVLADFEKNKIGEFGWLRVTTNMTQELKMSHYGIDSRDFRLRIHAGTVAMRCGKQRIKKSPVDLPGDTLPVIWRVGNGGPMSRFAGPEYTLLPAGSFRNLSLVEISRQLAALHDLDATVSQLSSEVTLEEQYPYEPKV
jgi:hypothetical protein